MHLEFIPPRVSKVLTPAAPCAPYSLYKKLSRDLGSLSLTDALELLKAEILASHPDASKVYLYRNAKSALLEIFRILKSKSDSDVVAMAAYTCPDVGAAALRAGFRILPLDVSEQGVDISPSLLLKTIKQENIAALVLSNLYGIADSISTEIQDLAVSNNVLVIDDACQSALSSRNSRIIGTSITSGIGVISFGRGKAYSGIGGGAILLAKDDHFKLNTQLQQLAEEKSDNNSSLKDGIASAMQWCFSNPSLYRIPASIPWLGLGETHCDTNFRTGGMSLAQSKHALVQVRRRSQLIEIFGSRTKLWREALEKQLQKGLLKVPSDRQPEAVCTRFPIIFERIKDKERFIYSNQRLGLGASWSYPAPLHAFSELHSALIQTPCLNSEKLARTLVTLPTHSYVTEEHISKTLGILEEL